MVAIVKLHQADVNKISYGNMKVLNQGGETTWLQYDGGDVYFQTPTMRSPFGASNFNKDEQGKIPKWTLQLSLDSDNSRTKAVEETLKKLTEKMINDCTKNPDWIKKPKATYKTAESLFSTMIQESSKPDQYPATFRVKLPCDENGKFFFDTYNREKTKIEDSDDSNIIDYFGRNSKVRFLLKPKFWCKLNNSFGCTWQVFQAEVFDNNLQGGSTQYSFQDDDDDRGEELLAEDSD